MNGICVAASARNRIDVSSVRPVDFRRFRRASSLSGVAVKVKSNMAPSQRQLSPGSVGEFGLRRFISHIRGGGDEDDPMMMP